MDTPLQKSSKVITLENIPQHSQGHSPRGLSGRGFTADTLYRNQTRPSSQDPDVSREEGEVWSDCDWGQLPNEAPYGRRLTQEGLIVPAWSDRQKHFLNVTHLCVCPCCDGEEENSCGFEPLKALL